MSPSERRQELLEVLCHRRHDTYDNLAFEFHVSRRTICRDVAILMCSYPIETFRGYGGGVRVANGYYLHHRTLNPRQVSLLIRLSSPVIKCKKTPRKKCSLVAEVKGKR